MAEDFVSLSWTCRNKKGRGETAPTFLIIAFHRHQYIRGPG